MEEGLREGEERRAAAPGERALEEEVENERRGRLHAVLHHHHARTGAHRLAQEVSPTALLHLRSFYPHGSATGGGGGDGRQGRAKIGIE